MATTGEGHSLKKGFARQMDHPNRDAPGSGNPLRRTNGFQSSIQLSANHTVVADTETENSPTQVYFTNGKSPDGSNRQRNGLQLGTRQYFYVALQG